MQSKAEMYAQMADHAAKQLTVSWQEWTAFLTTAARLYKYPYHEQLMIYAQRPDATACAEYDLWNEKMGRYVRRGSKGIALVDDSGDRPRLRYVFDISDTGTREHSHTPWLWTMEERHLMPVSAMLERNYGIGGNGFPQQLTEVARKLAEEYWAEHQQDFLYIVDGSFLEEYDSFNIEVQFKTAATISIAYSLMSRCGLEPEQYFDHEDFMPIFDFNTPETIGALGTAVSQINQQVLRQIGVTIRNAEREAIQERRTQHEQSHDLHPERGLSDSRPATERTAHETSGQVREDAENLSEGTPTDSIQPPVTEREAVPAPSGDRRDRTEPSGTADVTADADSGRDRTAESQQSHAVGGSDEHLQGTGGGDSDGGTYQQLTLNLFLSEAEQIQNIDEAENVAHTSSAFSFAQTDIDHVLRLGGNTDRQRERIVAAFEKQKSIAEIGAYLQTLYHGGNGITTEHGNLTVWYSEDGIRLSRGKSARHDASAQVISWQSAAERIGQLLEEGRFATNIELSEAHGYERSLLAEKLWHLYHDFSDEAKETGYLNSLSDIRGNGFPEETRRLAEQLKTPAFRQTLTEEYAAFWTAYMQDRGLLRFHYHKPKEIWENLKDLDLLRRTFVSDMTEVPAAKQFITEDEIDADMTRGSGFSGGKGRIFTFFKESHTDKEKVSFLKKEYGIGGHSHALSGATYSDEAHDGKGLHYKKHNCPDVNLTWEKVARRITDLIRKDRYLTEQEQAQYEKIQAEKELAEVESLSEPTSAIEIETAENPAKTLPAIGVMYEWHQEAKKQHSDAIVLVKINSGYLTFQEDAKLTSEELGLELVSRERIGQPKNISVCHLPGDSLENYLEQLDALHKPIVLADKQPDKDMDIMRIEAKPERIIEEPPLAQQAAVPHRELTQADIDAAIQEWNGSMESKHAVVRYMKDHAREKHTAAWLRQEYGDNLPAFPVTAEGAAGDIPWTKVQRRIAQLIQEERFYTQAEQLSEEQEPRFSVTVTSDAFPDPEDAFAIWDREIDNYYADDYGTVQTFPDEESAQKYLTDLEPENSQPVVQEEAERAEVPARNPLTPAYQVGDTVYLEGDPYKITGIEPYSVELLPPGLTYPVFRTESIQTFERLLKQDSRNQAITDYLSVPLADINDDLREVLTGDGGLLKQTDRETVAGHFRSGKGNAEIAEQLAKAYAGTVETVELLTGDTADYFASVAGLEINIHDKFGTTMEQRWTDVAAVLRTVYQLGQDGLTHEPVQPNLSTETVAVYPGDKNNLPYDVEIRRLRVEEPEPTPPAMTPEELDSNPVSVQIDGQWQTFPNTAAAEEAMYTEYKDQLYRNAQNFHITDDHLGEGGPKAKFQANINAIKLLKHLETEKMQASPEQQEVLSRYVGWGGLSDAFDPDKESWGKEYAQLKELLTPEEYAAARSSTLNAHYTSPTVIRAIYEAVGRMGFETGNILEPSCGVGNFFGMLPEEMQNSRLYGVELDSITGRIAKQLYPKADITAAGFETTDRRDFYDLAVGNVPFGQYQVNDKAYNKLNFNIHNYFFAKALDQVRPGGVVAFVTSRYTMDAKDSTVCRYLAQRGELLGAIRLPNNAFKANAGTEVVSDIIFLQKRDRPLDIVPEWTQTGQTEDGFAINRYFIDHPEMVLGRQEAESTAHGMDYTVNPIEGLELSDQLHDAVKYIRGIYQEAELPDLGEGEAIDTSLPADPNVKNYSYTVVDGEVYYRENSRMVRPELTATAGERVKGLVGLRECVQELIDLQMDASVPDSEIREKQEELDQLYDSFSAKYGLINDRGNRLAFADDSSYYLLCALEVIDEDGKLERKADMFTKRTIKPHQAVKVVDTAAEALAISISEKAGVDMAYMAELSGKTPEELAAELRGVIFHVPGQMEKDGTPHYVTADEYLSGNVRRKLRQAQRAAEKDPAFTVNVEALTAAQPKDLDASEIEVRLGATWIDKEYIEQFMYETFHTPYYLQRSIEVNYAAFTAEWRITGKNSVAYNDVAAYTTYGTSRANAYKILEDSLNLRDVRIYDTIEDADGRERRVLNAKETTLAAQKQQAIREAFRDWIWKDPERRQALVRQYNEEMNSTRPREYDGSHITFGGMNPAIQLREHQKNAIAHVLYGGNTLLAHEVGAGKTFEMVAAAMEAKRLGLCQKSLFVVPNHLTEQWASEFLRLYPSANILVTTKKDFETHNRKKFCARIATGDYDAIIMGHSQFERIPISRERQERLLYEQIDEITDGIAEVQSSGGERFTVKQLERTKKSLEARLEKLQAEGRKDDVVTFEQLGVDRLFVDEAHGYKNRAKRCA